MNRPLFALAALVLAGGTAGAIAVYVASPGGEEEVSQQPATVTATPASATPTPEASPATSPTVSPAASSTPDGIPTDWQTYNDPVFGFSLRHPPDLVFNDLTLPSPVEGIAERAVQFRSATDQRRSLLISVSSNPKGLALESWALVFAACNPKSIEPATLDAVEAISCNREVLGPPEPSVLAERTGKIFLLTAGEALTQSEFESVIQSFLF